MRTVCSQDDAWRMTPLAKCTKHGETTKKSMHDPVSPRKSIKILQSTLGPCSHEQNAAPVVLCTAKKVTNNLFVS